MTRSELTRVFARSASVVAALAVTGGLAWACGSNDDDGGTTDGGTESATPDKDGASNDSAVNTDAADGGDAADGANPADAAPKCSADAGFGAPTLVTELNSSADEASARLLDDGLTVYLSRGTAGAADHAIYVATRASTADAFGTLTAATDLVAPTSTENLNPTFTSDGLTVVWQWSDGAAPHLAKATRATKAAAFGAPTTLTALDADAPLSPWLSPSGDALWYGAQPAMSSLHALTRAAAPFNAAGTALFTAVGFYGDAYPVVTRDGLTLYFGTDRGAANPEILATQRASTADAFSLGNLAAQTPLYSPSPNFPTWISADGCTLYFSRNNGTDGDIYRASRGF